VSERTSVFVTGASGLIGRSLLARLEEVEGPPVVCLSRNLGAAPQRNARFVQGDLLEPGGWRSALKRCSSVVHLAAVSGKATAEQYARVNVEGTRRLIEECVQAGVRRFVHVSTIAVRYPDLSRYPYARSKLEAEALVRSSGLDWAIVRPTIVLGRRAPAWRSLSQLAKLPLAPLFGGGRARVQPILAADVAAALADLLAQERLQGEECDLGGPEVLTVEDLLQRIRRALGRGKLRGVRLPAGAPIALLAALEKPFLGLLPVTAGQLHALVYDGVAEPNPLLERQLPRMQPLDQALAELSRAR
jgi:NADH dehydrogenase